MTDLLKLHKDIIYDFWKVVSTLPTFIEPTDVRHKKCHNIFKETMADICPILESNILTGRKLDNYYKKLEADIVMMFEYDTLIARYYFFYTEEIFKHYLNTCNDNEIFEVSANLSKFIELMNKNKPEFI